MSGLLRHLPGLAAALLAVPAVPAAAQAADRSGGGERVWTSADGRTLRAAFISADEEAVYLKLRGGREARVDLDRLSAADREHIGELRRRGRAFALERLPDETRAPAEIEVEGGPRVFRTPHFEFETDRDVSRGFIAEAARVYEGTYAALSSLPHGLDLSPPEGGERYRGLFLEELAFSRIAGEAARTIPGQRVAGLYLPARRELLVPYSSLGARELGSRMTLRRTSDTTTLIHEIVHQLMHDWLPLLPVWFSEGIAEYIAAVPYQNGRFEFRNAERGLKERLRERYGETGLSPRGVTRPSLWLGLSGEGSAAPPWGGTVDEYRDALLLVYYFMHLDRRDAEGAPVGAYLRLVDSARDGALEIRRELDEFEDRRLAYNEEVQRYNGRLESFLAEAERYNERVRLHNEQLARGVVPEERVEVGEPPEEPVPPAELELPEVLREATGGGGAVDLVRLVRERSLPALVQGRDAAGMDGAVQEAFGEIGVAIGYR